MNSTTGNNANYNDKAAARARGGEEEQEEEEAEEEEANTQETFTQQLTQGNELTQLGVDDDDDYEDDDAQGGLSQSRDCHSPLTPIDPLTLPWGRLMPVGGGGPAATAAASINNDGSTTSHDANNAATAASERPSSSTSRGPTELLPRMPTWACGSRNDIIATRSRSPSVVLLNGGNGGSGNGTGGGDNKKSTTPTLKGEAGNYQFHSPTTTTPRIHFLGLKNLLPSDRFNEYVLGRSIKVRGVRGH